MTKAAAAILLSPSRPIVRPRSPLVFPPGSYDRTLPWTPPQTRDFLRADAWGVPVPGLPFVPRGSAEHPERFLTYLDYKYSWAWRWRGLDAHVARGYTHWIRSWPDARSDGGHSLDRFVADCLLVKQRLPYVQVKLNSKIWDARDQSPAQWAAQLDPVMDALIATHAVDEFALWEWDAHNVPGDWSIRALKHLGQKAHAGGCSFWLHFLPGHTSWFADGDPRGRYGFYDDLGGDVDGLDYQSRVVKLLPMAGPDDPEWDVPMLQARLVDTLTQFANQGFRHKLRAFELTATAQFSGDFTEDQANTVGFLACCTANPAHVWGYGNGARRADGRPL